MAEEQIEAFRESWSSYANSICTEDMIVADLFIVEDGAIVKFLDNTATSVEIPAGVTSIPSGVFSNRVKTITVSAENTVLKAVENVVYTADGKTLVYYLAGKADTEFTIPEGVENVIGITNVYLDVLTIGADVIDISAKCVQRLQRIAGSHRSFRNARDDRRKCLPRKCAHHRSRRYA